MKILTVLLLALVALAPPSGRPPTGPLERFDPKLNDLRYEVSVNTQIPFGQDDPRYRSRNDKRSPQWGGTIRVENTPIIMPIVFNGTYHFVDPDSVRGNLWLGTWFDTGLRSRFRVDTGGPHHGQFAVLPIERFVGKQFRWNVEYRVQTFSSRINEQGAARLTWPREWPDDVADGFKAQLFIESDNQVFRDIVERVTSGRIRLVAPYYAAKELVRHCIKVIAVNGNGIRRGRAGVLHGMDMVGAARAVRDGRGSPHDLVCVCVAVLRAGGIPARPVIGIEEDEKGRDIFVTWAEFYLPEAGWIPFDPDVMRGKGMHRPVDQAWPEFGTMTDLNERVPLAYHFVPPQGVQSPMSPAVWGWDPRPAGAPSAEQIIRITVSGRGRGVEDPR